MTAPVLLADLVELVSEASAWAYLLLAAVALLDALLPIVPSETAVIAAGVVAATGQLRLSLVVLVAAVGATLGDNLTYALGRRWGSGLGQRVRSRRVRRRLDWAKAQLDHRGGELIVVGRFIPGGRIAVNLSAGSLGYPWSRFVVYDLGAAALWALYAAGLGFFGGEVFKDSPWKGLLLALAVAVVVAGAREAVRAWRRSSRQ